MPDKEEVAATADNAGQLNINGALIGGDGLVSSTKDNGVVHRVSTSLYVDKQSIDMGGIRVNAALLTEYNCSHDGYDKTDNKGAKQHFSSRFDCTVLNNLYDSMGFGAFANSYRVVKGTWRDF